METKIYWSERLEKETQKNIDSLTKSMFKIYKTSIKNINKEIESFYGRYAENNNLTIQEVNKRLNHQELKSAKEEIERYYNDVDRLTRENGKVSVEKLQKYKNELRLQSAKAYMSRLEEIKINIKNVIVNMAIEEDINFTENMENVYNNSHSYSSFSLDKSLGFSSGYVAPNQEILEKAIRVKWLGDNYSDRIWKNKIKLLNTIESVFLQGVARGQNPRKIADDMVKVYRTAYYNFERLARTELIHAQNEATFQTYKEHGIKQYRYIASLSERTCPICGSLDRKIFKLSEKMEGVNYPVMHPNCRCTTIAYFEPTEIDKLFDEETRIARDKNKQWVEVPSSMTYKQWLELVNN